MFARFPVIVKSAADFFQFPKPGFILLGIGTDFAGNGVLLGGDADQVKPCLIPVEIAAIDVKWHANGKVYLKG